MSKNKNRGNKAFSGVNPQGYADGGSRDMSPKSQLEDRAKHSNTKR
ncbi:small, acid-soluble spore protein L [Bacillus sp. B190/17]|uniref:Small, acid-soluble spore protein L n=1 Tax=Bacillus lumedeiriae TaxID=3058829 RepID=A0ABW8I5P3_9BACI